MKKTFSIILILLSFSVLFCGCNDNSEIETETETISVDVSNYENFFEITLEEVKKEYKTIGEYRIYYSDGSKEEKWAYAPPSGEGIMKVETIRDRWWESTVYFSVKIKPKDGIKCDNVKFMAEIRSHANTDPNVEVIVNGYDETVELRSAKGIGYSQWGYVNGYKVWFVSGKITKPIEK